MSRSELPVAHDTQACPDCGKSWKGAVIPKESREFYGTATHFGLLLGVEVEDVYDGVLLWRCPFCKHTWHRFSGERVKKGDQVTRHGVAKKT